MIRHTRLTVRYYVVLLVSFKYLTATELDLILLRESSINKTVINSIIVMFAIMPNSSHNRNTRCCKGNEKRLSREYPPSKMR